MPGQPIRKITSTGSRGAVAAGGVWMTYPERARLVFRDATGTRREGAVIDVHLRGF